MDKNWWEETPPIESKNLSESGKYPVPCPNCARILTVPYWHRGNVRCPVCRSSFPLGLTHTENNETQNETLVSIVVIVTLIGVALIVIGFMDFGPTIHDVRYEISSNCETVDVFYENEWGGSSSKTVDTGPGRTWSYSYQTEFDGFTFMYVSGQANCGQDEVSVIASLYIDNELADWEPCEGGYCIATASDMRQYGADGEI